MTNEQKIKINEAITQIARLDGMCSDGQTALRGLIEVIIGEPLIANGEPIKAPRKEWKVGSIVKPINHAPFVVTQIYGDRDYYASGMDGRLQPFSNKFTHEKLDELIQAPGAEVVGHVEWVQNGQP